MELDEILGPVIESFRQRLNGRRAAAQLAGPSYRAYTGSYPRRETTYAKADLLCLVVVWRSWRRRRRPHRDGGKLSVKIANGRATVIAKDVPVRQILAEWAKVGETKIVNGEKVPGGPVTLELIDVPEKEALDILLRTAAGYIAAPRPANLAGASQYDRVIILATSRPPAATASMAPPPFGRPAVPPSSSLRRMTTMENPAIKGPMIAPGMGPNGPMRRPGPTVSDRTARCNGRADEQSGPAHGVTVGPNGAHAQRVP